MPPRKRTKKTSLSSAKNASTPPGLPTGTFEAICNRIAEYKEKGLSVVEGFTFDDNDENYKEVKCYGVVVHNKSDNVKQFRCLASAKCLENHCFLHLGRDAKGDWVSSNATRL